MLRPWVCYQGPGKEASQCVISQCQVDRNQPPLQVAGQTQQWDHVGSSVNITMQCPNHCFICLTLTTTA